MRLVMHAPGRFLLPVVLGLLVLLLLVPTPAAADDALGLPMPVLAQEDVSWTNVGSDVRFQLRFRNPEVMMSEMVSGEIRSQEYGAFVPDYGPIGTFDVPPIPPESFFDVFVDVPRSQLPESALEIHPGPLAPQGFFSVAQVDTCPPDDHWDGNVDVFWIGSGGMGQTWAHHGTLHVCPGQGNSYIHVVTNCAAFAPWAIVGVCPGFSVTLVNEDLTAAPNPVPPGWTGHICVSAAGNVPIGTQCCFAVNFTCLGVMVPVNLCATACPCEPVPVEPTTWGRIKAKVN